MRFSSKPWVAHNGSNTDGLYYYGYRFYDPLTQRWLNRDPLGEPGFETLRHNRSSVLGSEPNRYLFVKNNPINSVDLFGLMDSITLGFLGCVRGGNSPAFCACVLAPDPEECEAQFEACIDAIGKIPNPKTGKIQKPSREDICKCACSLMYQDEKDKKKKENCQKACEKKLPKCP
jgi:RHS repeat-associated protein